MHGFLPSFLCLHFLFSDCLFVRLLAHAFMYSFSHSACVLPQGMYCPEILFWVQRLLHAVLSTQLCACMCTAARHCAGIDVATTCAAKQETPVCSAFHCDAQALRKTVHHWPTGAHNVNFCISYLIMTWLIWCCALYAASFHLYELVAARSEMSLPASQYDFRKMGHVYWEGPACGHTQSSLNAVFIANR